MRISRPMSVFAIAVVVAGPAFAGERIETWSGDGCTQSKMTALKSDGRIFLSYSMIDACEDLVISFGEGYLPLSSWSGSIGMKKISLKANPATVQNFANSGQPVTFNLVFTKTPAFTATKTISETISGQNIEPWKTAQKEVKYSADVTGNSNMFDTPGQGTMTFVGAVK